MSKSNANHRAEALAILDLVNKEDIVQWKMQPVTKALLSMVREDLNDIKDAWVEGVYTGEDANQTIQLNSQALGKAEALSYLETYIELMQTVKEDSDAN